MIVQTEFDGLLEEDVIFEETDQVLEYQDILKNSENLLKSFLYMKKMFNSTPLLNKLVKVETVEFGVSTEYPVDIDTNTIMVKNVDNINGSIFIDGGELILLPFESFEFPYIENVEIRLIGKISIVQSQYSIT